MYSPRLEFVKYLSIICPRFDGVAERAGIRLTDDLIKPRSECKRRKGTVGTNGYEYSESADS